MPDNPARRKNCADCVWVTDDIGTQTGPMFGLDVFREFFKPRYAAMIEAAHDNNMHFWLHSCGNIELFIEDFIEIGLDVLHPIQKYTMDEREIAPEVRWQNMLLGRHGRATNPAQRARHRTSAARSGF